MTIYTKTLGEAFCLFPPCWRVFQLGILPLCVEFGYVDFISAMMSLESKRLYLIPHLSKDGATKLKQLLLHTVTRITLVRCLG